MHNHIQRLRQQWKWTQQQLAEQLDVSRQTIIAIEKGKYDPSLPLAFRIAAVFGLRIEDIFVPDESAAPSSRRPRSNRYADNP